MEYVVPGDVGLRVEGDKDEDAEGGREDKHGHVPREGGVPVGQQPDPGHELQVLHLEENTGRLNKLLAGLGSGGGEQPPQTPRPSPQKTKPQA